MFVLAHLSDPHLAPLPRPRIHELIGKRIGGYINWQRNRRSWHLAAVLERIVADLKAQAPDHIAVTGDLLNLSLAAEYALAGAWLEQLGPARDVTLVPGNHDTYVMSKARHPERHWAEQMRGDVSSAGAFPLLRRRGRVALIGLSSAVPAPPFRATGRVGEEQLARFGQYLAALGREGLFRVVLIHHPPVMRPQDHSHRLIDGDDFLAVLRTYGAELVLHGHEHTHSLRRLEGPQGSIPAVGVPSASVTIGSRYEPAAYNLYRIAGAPGAWCCDMVSRGLSADGTAIVELKRQPLLES
jgi:3',5'-cyclic AMP phosphodiesterase CpdA